MRRPLATVGLAAVLLAVWPMAARAQSDATPVRRSEGKVLILSYPGLRWDEVLQQRPPVLLELLKTSAVASMSVRTIGPYTSLGEAYATIGAGNRATAEEAFAGIAYPPRAAVESDLAAEVLARRCGCRTAGMNVVHLGMPRLATKNDHLLYGAKPGSLGEAVRSAHGRTAVVANADRQFDATGDLVHREAALAVVDEEGRAARGEVGPGLVVKDPSAPFGVRTSTTKTSRAIKQGWAASDVLLVEVSDLDRSDRYADLSTEAAAASARAVALRRADALLAVALAQVDLSRDLVIVVGPTAPRGPAQLTVAAMKGRGVEPGLVVSATTRRPGFVTLPDIAPTVLTFLGIDVPSDMTGTAMHASGGGVTESRLSSLADDNEVAMFRDRATGPASVTFIVLQVLGYGLAALALTRWRRARAWVAWFLLVPLAQAPLAFLSGLVHYERLTVPGYVVVHVAAGVVLGGLALLAARRSRRWLGDAAELVAPLSLMALTAVVLGVDVLVGGPLQINTVFGYSPTVAGRFSGYGNLAFALLGAGSIMAVSGAWSMASMGSATRAPRRRVAGLALIVLALVVVVALDGLPSLGADVGGVLSLVPAGAVVVLLLAGVRLNWSRVLLIICGTGGVLVTFALVDLSRPEDSRTHLGRLAAKVLHADNGGVTTVLRRKVEANISILTSSVWTWVIPVALVFMVFLVWRRPGSLASLEERVPGLHAGLVGSLVAGIVGFAVNDSGIAVPAMMLAVVLPYVAFLLVQTAD